jgi:hypothetical protein
MNAPGTVPYSDPRPETKIGRLRTALYYLIEEHVADGTIPTSAPFLYYELIQRQIISKQRTGARRSDQDLSVALTDLRERGHVPWNYIVDETRSVEDFTGSASIAAEVIDRLGWFRIDPWGGWVPLVLTESRSLAGVLRSIARRYAIRIASTNGQCGGFLHTDIVPLLTGATWVIYLGDLDLAGNDIEINTRRVLEREIGAVPQWQRLALTAAQVTDFNLPPIVKEDRRFKDGRPHEAVETEALSQGLLMDLLRRRLDEMLLEPLADVLEREEQERAALARRLRRR